MEENYPRQDLYGFKARIDRNPWSIPEQPNYSKIIFLNKENLAELEGYKASIEVYGGLCGKQEIHIILTGFSWDSAQRLFDKVKGASNTTQHKSITNT